MRPFSATAKIEADDYNNDDGDEEDDKINPFNEVALLRRPAQRDGQREV